MLKIDLDLSWSRLLTSGTKEKILLASRAKFKSFRMSMIFVRPDRALCRAKFSNKRRQDSSVTNHSSHLVIIPLVLAHVEV